MHKKIITGIFTVSALFLGVVFVFWSWRPLHQTALFSKSFREVRAGNPEMLFEKKDKIFYPFTFVQPELRYQFIDFLFRDFSENPTPGEPPALATAIFMLEESLERQDSYANHLLALGKAYDLRANLGVGDPVLLRRQAQEQYEKALAIFPDNQRITFAYAINIANQGEIDKAVETVERVYTREPRLAESSFYYGALLYMKDNDANANIALPYLEAAFDKIGNPMPALTKPMYRKLFRKYYYEKDLERFTAVTKRLIVFDPEQKDAYTMIHNYIQEHGRIPVIELGQ